MGYIGGGKVVGIAKNGIDSKYEFSLRKIRRVRRIQRFYFPIVIGESGAGSWVGVQKRSGKFQWLRYVENFSLGMQLIFIRDHRVFDDIEGGYLFVGH